MKIVVDERLPKLSWLLTITKDENTLLCGSSVNVNDNMIYEGSIYFSNKEKNYFSLSNLHFGSGVFEHQDKQITIFTPSHVFDYVWIIKNNVKNEIYVSNSIFFCLSKINADVNLLINSPFQNLFKGIGKFDRLIKKTNEYEIYGCSLCQVYIKNLQIKFADMIYQNHFNNFEEYHAYLKDVIQQCYDNFNSDKAIVYLSKGYDSVCCATLVSEMPGIENKIALCKIFDKHGLDDSGVEIAQTLKMQTIVIPETERDFELVAYQNTDVKYKAVLFSEKDNDRLLDFCSFWDYPHDESLYCENVDYNNSIVLIGVHGDVIWDFKGAICDDFERLSHDLGGASLTEYRLKKGFCYLPLPAIASVLHSDLVKICNSEEMKPYIVGGNYDRPIPRRIAEDYGKIQRGTFATNKQAIATQIKSFPQRSMLLQRKINEYKTIIEN